MVKIILTVINFSVDLFSRMPKSKFYVWIYFREWSNFSDFAWNSLRSRQSLYLKNKMFFSCLCLRILTGKKHRQIKLQRLEKVRIWGFGLFVQ